MNPKKMNPFARISLLLALLVLSLSSCEEIGVFRKPRWVGVINNDTPYLMNIRAFSNSIEEYTIEIAANEKYELSIYERYLDEAEGIFYKETLETLEPGNRIDSVQIIFNRNKRILQYCDGDKLWICDTIPKNLVKMWDKENQVKDKDGNLLFGYLYEYHITFTIDDYVKAEDF